jgi:hypothetical protein
MVFLDHYLIAEARQVATGANIHTIRRMIFAYEQAVVLHNAGRPAHEVYRNRYELALRQFVAQEKAKFNSEKMLG